MGDTASRRKIRVFLASPGDVVAERQQFRDAIEQLNLGFADGANVEFEAVGWEDTIASTGGRSQSVINADVDRCNVFFLLMHRRWGQNAPDADPYESYTEEEFHRALDRSKKTQCPTVLVFFKHVEPEQEADPGPQLKKVLEFRRNLEDTKEVLYRKIDSSDNSFLNEVDKHLRAFVKGELPNIDSTGEGVILPLKIKKELEKARSDVQEHARAAKRAKRNEEVARLRIEQLRLESAEDAAKLATKGMIEHAREKFVKLYADSRHPEILFLAYEFFHRTGDLDSALKVLNRWMLVHGSGAKSADSSAVLGNLGLLYVTKGDFNSAEKAFRQVLDIDQELKNKEGTAIAYGNLGMVYKDRGDLEQAKEVCGKSLELYKDLELKEGMAAQYGNLGIVFEKQDDYDQAEEFYDRARELFEELDHKVGMACQYGNLG